MAAINDVGWVAGYGDEWTQSPRLAVAAWIPAVLPAGVQDEHPCDCNFPEHLTTKVIWYIFWVGVAAKLETSLRN